MFWSPVVRRGLVGPLGGIDGLELFINDNYTEAVNALRQRAARSTADANNPAFRMLQILGHMRSTNK